ncbi:MAG TPA: acetate uptake transporter, partial [Solirubrobacteraceae bacterium]
SYWLLVTFNVSGIPAVQVHHALGLYLWAWAIFTAYMTVAALRTSGAVLLVFALLTVTFVLLAIGASGAHQTVTHWGGYIGLATAAAAWYASFAIVTNSTFNRTVLPVMPLGDR